MMMKRISAIAAVLSLCFCAWGQTGVESRSVRCTTKFQGLEREYLLYIPEGVGEGAPLVMALHGYGGGMRIMPEGLLDAADRHGYAVCLPQALKDGTGHTGWNVGYVFQKDYKVKDIEFVCHLAKMLCKEHGFRKDATFLTGMSNGGEMCHLMAMRKPKAFTAIASIAGLSMTDMLKEYPATGPVPFMEVHGTEDRISEWYGDPLDEGGWGAYTSTPIAIGRVVTADGCKKESVEILPRREGRNEVTLYKFEDGKKTKDGRPMEVWLYEVKGGDHSWSDADMDTYEETWRFFTKWFETE